MYVCLCHGLTDQDISENLKNGCHTLKQLQKSCKAGTSCGACIMEISQILKTAKTSKDLSKKQDCLKSKENLTTTHNT